MNLITDPAFYAAAIPAVFFVGLSKGGFGGAMALLGVPMMSLVISPVQAAAIMLPILIVMDMASLWIWRGRFDRRTLWIMVPGGALGILIGWATAAWIEIPAVRLIVGGIAIIFALDYLRGRLALTAGAPASHNRLKGTFWGTIAGFTSFVTHAGGPPYQFYTLPLNQDPKDIHGHIGDLLCDHQCDQAGPVLRTRTVRRDQCLDFARTDAHRAVRDIRRRLAGPSHEPRAFLPVHVCYGIRGRAQVSI